MSGDRRGRYDRALSSGERAGRLRERLVDAGRSVLLERGALDVTVSRVIAQAGTGRNTFYAHFDDIDDLLAEVRERGLDELLAPIAELLADARTPIERLRTLVRLWLAQVRERPDVARAVLSAVVGIDPAYVGSRATQRVFEMLHEIVLDAYDNGVVSQRPDEMRTWALASAMTGVGVRQVATGRAEPRVAEALVSMVLATYR